MTKPQRLRQRQRFFFGRSTQQPMSSQFNYPAPFSMRHIIAILVLYVLDLRPKMLTQSESHSMMFVRCP